MDIEGWLRNLGLERYEAAFRENEIDDTILPRLAAEDLKELGVGPVGHRRKLLDAIAALRADSNAPAPLPAPSPTAPPMAARATPRYNNNGGSWRTPLPHGHVLRPSGFARLCGS